MLARPAHAAPTIFLFALLCASTALRAQSMNSQAPEKTTLPSGIDRLAGQNATSHIQYVRLVLSGSLRTDPSANAPAPSLPPTLIAQCTLRPSGKYLFELFANFGGATDLSYYPPWVPTSKEDLFPPTTEKATITMEFLGYTHVKPVRRQWEVPAQTPGQYRYNPPGAGSANLEEIGYYLRYLASLPTLRLTLGNRSADFLTTPLLSEIRKEPLCRAAA
jgi:hypothetical protein